MFLYIKQFLVMEIYSILVTFFTINLVISLYYPSLSCLLLLSVYAGLAVMFHFFKLSIRLCRSIRNIFRLEMLMESWCHTSLLWESLCHCIDLIIFGLDLVNSFLVWIFLLGSKWGNWWQSCKERKWSSPSVIFYA